MVTKNISLVALVRDPQTNEIVTSDPGFGTTEDEGTTVVIPHGYMPNILTVNPSDILRTLIPIATDIGPPSGVSRVDDPDLNTSTLTFTP